MSYEPKFRVSSHLLRTVEEIAALREKILTATVQVPWIPTLQREARVRNAHSSTGIEGNPLTLEEVRALEEGRALPTATDRSRREVLNYFAGLRYIEKHRLKGTIRGEDVLKLHAIISTGVMDQGAAGKFRDIRVRVGSYYPPAPDMVPGMMTDLMEWWNKQAPKWSAVLSSAVLHYRFEEIHPFADGNGRTGRTLALWELYRRGFDTHHIFSVDEVYRENRPRYYRMLGAVRLQEGELSDWLEYSADAVHLTLDRVWERVQRLEILAGKPKLILRPKQERLLQLLREHKTLSPREIWDGIGVSRQGAMDLLRPLLKAGVIKKVGTKKSGKYTLA